MKKLSELNDYDRALLYPVILEEHKAEWAEWFREEKERLESLAGSYIASIRHIGSTSVIGLIAKPTIDILLEIKDLTDLNGFKKCFSYPEYICLDRQTVPTNDLLLFLKGYTPEGFADRVFHIHTRLRGDWDEVYFRDYLASNVQSAEAYAALKAVLKDKYEFDRDAYTNAKTAFIAEITAKARNCSRDKQGTE